MGADWYFISTYYGYVIRLPADVSFRRFLAKLDKRNASLPSPFEFGAVLEEFHSRMEGADDHEMDDMATVFLGFTPSNDLEEFVKTAKDLERFVKDNTDLSDLEIQPKAKFISGHNWFETEEGEEEEDEEVEE